MWNQKDLPHKGWVLIDVVDTEELESSCDMCGNSIRYIHVLKHYDYTEQIGVGCHCAETLTQDYVNHEAKAKKLKKDKKGFFGKWKISKAGNPYLWLDDNRIVIYQNEETQKYRAKIYLSNNDVKGGNIDFDTKSEAKDSIWKGINILKKRGEW